MAQKKGQILLCNLVLFSLIFNFPAMPFFVSIPELASGSVALQESSRLHENAPIKPEQAIALAISDIEATEEGYLLRHPRHITTFNQDGLQITPRPDGPQWAWQLGFVGTSETTLADVNVGAVQSVNVQPGVVSYARGGLFEQYVIQKESLEQQFVIPNPLTLEGNDLVIDGAVHTEAEFEQIEDGWRWRTNTGGISLGDVRVFDATGKDLPASMTVTANGTHIVVDGAALSQAAYPVIIDPEIGANDFRLSDMGGDRLYDAELSAVAFNNTNNEYFVVWLGDDNTGSLVHDEYEIWGQRVNAATGAEIEGVIRLSDMDTDGNSSFDAFELAVAYNSTDNEYLVVWRGEDNISPLVNSEYEIFGQRVDAATGEEIGDNDFRISDMGATNGDTAFGAFSPAVTYNSSSEEYLIVWSGDDTTNDEFEIFGQLLTATGTFTGTNDFRISDMGATDGITAFGAFNPAVTYNSSSEEYLVVWEGDDDTAPLVDNEFEIFGQRLNAAGVELGTNDFRISDMGATDGDTAFGAFDPAVIYNSIDNQYLVVWDGDDTTDGEFEIFGQRLDSAAVVTGTNDFRISDMGPDGNIQYSAINPDVTYNSTDNQYLVVWEGDDNIAPLVEGETEIFGQRLTASGAETGNNDFRLSDMGPDGSTAFDASMPFVAYGSTDNQYLVVWRSDDNTGLLVDSEFEIFGQRLDSDGTALVPNDFRISDMGAEGDPVYSAFDPAVAYNSTNMQYLIVWEGDDNTGDLVNEEFEIWGQRVDAVSGAELGSDFRISNMGTDGNIFFGATNPAVAYDGTNNRYLVVWQGDHTNDNEFEIYGQRVNANGSMAGSDFRVSKMGPDGDALYSAFNPTVAYNSNDKQFLVVWEGDDSTDGEFEIFGQGLDVTGVLTATTYFRRISDMGPDGNSMYGAFSPAVTYNSTDNQYLVVWEGDDSTNDEFEIFGQRLDASVALTGTNDFRISDMGPDGVNFYGALSPALAYNSTDNQYLVVWEGDDSTDEEFEIYSQRLDAAGVELGTDFRLSVMGPDGNTSFDAFNPSVTYNHTANEFLVVWHGDDNTGSLVDGEFEIFGQRVDAAGIELAGKFRLSDMGPDSNTSYGAFHPAVAYSSTDKQYLVVWDGDDDTAPLVDGEFEIFGQRFIAQADLSLTKSATPEPVKAGAILTYTLSAANAGPNVASNVAIADTLPNGTTYNNASGNGWTCGEDSGVVTCTRPSLSIGSAPAITLTVTAPVDPGTIDNSANVSSGVEDPDTSNNSSGAQTSVTPVANLSLAKSASPEPVQAGELLTYTLSVANAGPSSSSTLTVTDTLPAGTTYNSASGDGWTCGESSGVVTCTRPSLSVGAAPDITLTVTAPPDPGMINNSASVSSSTEDPDATNNSDSAESTVTPVADLSLTKSGTPDTVKAGAMLTYTLSITNTGPSAASAVTVTDNLPAGSTYTSALGDGWTCGEDSGVVTCTRPFLSVGTAPAITLKVNAPPDPGAITNSAYASSSAEDSDATNNSDSVQTTVTPHADLSITKSASPESVNAGATLTYTLSVTNAGPSAASAVSVVDTLPGGITFQSASGDGWTCNQADSVLICTRPTLSAGSAPVITLNVTAPANPGTINNSAVVSSGTEDPNVANNSGSVSTMVLPVADLSLTKSASPEPVQAGATLTYTLNVANGGPHSASTVTVSDTLPNGTTYNSALGAGWTCGGDNGVVTCTRPALSVGAAPVITLKVTAPISGGTITNSASVDSSAADPDTSDNSDSVDTTVVSLAPSVDLTKDVTPASRLEPGGVFTFTLTITNTSIESVTVTDLTDDNSLSQECDSLVGQSIPAGQAVSCSYTVTHTAIGTYDNIASVTVQDNEANTASDSASAEVTVRKRWRLYLPLIIR